MQVTRSNISRLKLTGVNEHTNTAVNDHSLANWFLTRRNVLTGSLRSGPNFAASIYKR